MAKQIEYNDPPVDMLALGKRMLVGAWIGFILIALFLLSVRNPDPAWGEQWWVRPLAVVTFAGAMGGLCNYFILYYARILNINRSFAILFSLLVYIIGYYLGSVLGLVGTLWH
ncbi:potassium transporter KefB [Pontibacter sp. H259]|uniref:potassium transporter KefB n=1 Tax=Pontibacter sp. H259 TaxID=3133421 RepID=UPI0030BBC25F